MTRFDSLRFRAAAAVAVVLIALAIVAGTARPSHAEQSLGRLQSQLAGTQARAQNLSAAVASLGAVIRRLDAQVALVQRREAAVESALADDRAALAGVQRRLGAEQARAAMLRGRLAADRVALARSLVSAYESDRPDLVRVVLEAHGFRDLIEQVTFMHRAMSERTAIITTTRSAKAASEAIAADLARLEARDRAITRAEALRAAALAGMNRLLSARQAAAAAARAAQRQALAAARSRGARLKHAIAKVQAEQAAAEQAAGASGGGAALGPSAGWAIPYAIVLCESGGQNLPPNSAGASGYYQIIPSTWTSFGGSGPAAWLTSKAEQDAVAARIYNGGAGVSNWDCAAIVGIH